MTFKKFLQRIGQMGGKAEAFISEHGTEYIWRPLPKRYERGPNRQCFMNAARLALEHGKLTYVEGYGSIEIFGALPIHHAWCIDREGLVIDPTWTDPRCQYVGIPISNNLLRAELQRTKTYGILFERGVKFNTKMIEKWKRELVEDA